MRVTGEGRWRATTYGLISLLAIGASGTVPAQQTTLDK